MCEYCGCQALPQIAELTREHDQVVNLVGDIRTAHRDADVPRMAWIARRVSAVLVPHTAVEEQGLFPPLTEEFPDGMAALRAEHRHVEAVLDEAAAGVPADPGWPRRLLDALDLLRDHILKEQDGVFPAALAGLSTEDWEAMDAVRSRVGTMSTDFATTGFATTEFSTEAGVDIDQHAGSQQDGPLTPGKAAS
ncbi:hemerythrin domain-containing protein [Streptomyces sp. NBC_00576]|uniref:hemerythrin domain-containing protein n=1 Tax=Streptomyces sp. NBC_00576 TaxID=2903665 RepID=UPI002E808688|nr:hemerythrin domain-containing protein [Streptomyces sp. NBC_00576]WUB75858.1 hemerythrin domain-containing protein [Streptomyces sp. NBC_00576]